MDSGTNDMLRPNYLAGKEKLGLEENVLGCVYWILPKNGVENTDASMQLYQSIQGKKRNVVLLSASRNKNLYQYDYDLQTDDESRRDSADRDARLCMFFSKQGFDVVYSASERFEDVERWVDDNISHCQKMERLSTLNRSENGESVEPGTLYWITGLSGAGKTTIGKLLYEKIKNKKLNVVLMDGDMLRSALKRYDYSRIYREKRSYRDVRICKMITDQGIDIVWCGINMFDGVREWSRKHIKNYIEIYLEVPMEVLFQRDTKGLYAGAKEGRIKDVVGMDQKAELPKFPDIHYVNDGSASPKEVMSIIWKQLEQMMDKKEKIQST